MIVNVHLRGVDAASFFLTSFHGAYASDGDLVLSDASGGNKHDAIFSATWTQDSHQVDMQVQKNVIAGREYSFSFEGTCMRVLVRVRVGGCECKYLHAIFWVFSCKCCNITECTRNQRVHAVIFIPVFRCCS